MPASEVWKIPVFLRWAHVDTVASGSPADEVLGNLDFTARD